MQLRGLGSRPRSNRNFPIQAQTLADDSESSTDEDHSAEESVSAGHTKRKSKPEKASFKGSKSSKASYQTPARSLSPNERIAKYQRRQLRPGRELEKFSTSVIDHINGLLQWHNLRLGQIYVQRGPDKSLRISLIEWTSYTFISSSTDHYWDGRILELDPSLLQRYTMWEEVNWKYVFQIPRFFSRDMYCARDKLIDAFTAYFRLPQSQREDAAWFVPTAEAEMRDIGLDDDDLGRAHMLQNLAYV